MHAGLSPWTPTGVAKSTCPWTASHCASPFAGEPSRATRVPQPWHVHPPRNASFALGGRRKRGSCVLHFGQCLRGIKAAIERTATAPAMPPMTADARNVSMISPWVGGEARARRRGSPLPIPASVPKPKDEAKQDELDGVVSAINEP